MFDDTQDYDSEFDLQPPSFEGDSDLVEQINEFSDPDAPTMSEYYLMPHNWRYVLRGGTFGQSLRAMTAEDIAYEMVSEAGDPEFHELALQVGEPDSDWQMALSLRWDDEEGKYRYQMNHQRHDEKWAERTEQFAKLAGIDHFEDIVRKHPQHFDELPEDTRWEALELAMEWASDEYRYAHQLRDAESNARMLEIARELNNLPEVVADENYMGVERVQDSYYYASNLADELFDEDEMNSVLEDALLDSEYMEMEDEGLDETPTTVERPHVETWGPKRPAMAGEFTIEGTAEDPGHRFTAQELVDIMTLTASERVGEGQGEAQFTVNMPGSSWQTRVTLEQTPGGAWTYDLDPIRPEGEGHERKMTSLSRLASPDYFLQLVDESRETLRDTPEETRWDTVEDMMWKAKGDYMRAATGGNVSVYTNLQKLSSAFERAENVKSNPGVMERVGREVSEARDEALEGMEFAADDLSWEDLDLRYRKMESPVATQHDLGSVEDFTAQEMPESRFQPVKLTTPALPESVLEEYRGASDSHEKQFGRRSRRGI